jgi:SagB-type dehydrogenase family enzyme
VKTPDVVTAETIGAAAKYDPQLRIPSRPRLRRGLSITVDEQEMTVEGGPKRQLFRGRSATELLPGLLALTDGSRTHAGLAAELDVPEEMIFKAVALLWTCGVVEEAPPDPPSAVPVADELADLLSRLGDSTGANEAWEQAADRLQAVRVEVFGADDLAALFADALRDSLPVRLAREALPQPDTTMVVCLNIPGDALVADCWARDIPLLRLRITGRRAILGPLVHPGLTPCLDCLTTVDDEDARPHGEGDVALATALFAREIFALVSRAMPVPLPVRWRSVDLETLAYTEVSAATRPACRRCSVASGPVAAQASLAARYEASVALPPKAFADLKAHQMHYKPSNLALQEKSRTWPVAAAVPLPPPSLDRLTAPAANRGKLAVEELSLLLALTAGIKGRDSQRVLRWTASGGNIGSVTAYAVVRDVPGLESGIYGYVSAEHRLASLSPQVEGICSEAPVTLVLTGDFPKVAQKYSAFALRIVLLDSGCAQATARETARVLGLGYTQHVRWDDEAIARALRVNPELEPVTTVIDLEGDR